MDCAQLHHHAADVLRRRTTTTSPSGRTSEVDELQPDADGGFTATRRRGTPRYVDEVACIGCRLCEYACPVDVPHAFEGSWGPGAPSTSPSTRPSRSWPSSTPTHCIFCGKCAKVCPTDAIDFAQQPRTATRPRQRRRAGHRLSDHADRRQGRVQRRGRQRHQRPGHGAAAVAQRPLRARAATLGREDPGPRRLRPVRRLARRDAGRAVLLARLLHVRHQAGHAPLGRAAPGRHHHLLHGHPRLRQGLRAVLPDGPGHGHRVRQGQGRPHRRAARRGPAACASSASRRTARWPSRVHDLVVLSVGMQPGDRPALRSSASTSTRYGFVASPDPKLDTTRTSVPGLFAAGTAIAPKDIVDSVVEASAAAARVEAYLASEHGARPRRSQPLRVGARDEPATSWPWPASSRVPTMAEPGPAAWAGPAAPVGGGGPGLPAIGPPAMRRS